MGERLYFLAIIPPDPVLQEIEDMKYDIATRFQSSHALRSPAHITLIPPFKSDTKTLHQITKQLQNISAHTNPIAINLNGFGNFSPNVLYVAPETNEVLHQLHKIVIDSTEEFIVNNGKQQHRFHPHITIAFRDLSLEQFENAWSHFEQKVYKASFVANAFYLLIHENKEWHIHSKFSFSTKYTPISCSFHSELEHRIVHKNTVNLIYYNQQGSIVQCERTLIDIYTKGKEEYLTTDNQEHIRLDYIIEVDGLQNPDSTNAC